MAGFDDSALVLHADKARLFVFSPSMTLGEGQQRTIKVKLDVDALICPESSPCAPE